MKLRTLAVTMYHLASVEEQYPGNTTTKGLELAIGLAVANYLGEEVDSYVLLTDKDYSSDATELGKAFAAGLMHNQGNKYAATVVARVLNSYNGKQVPEKVGELLKLLENFLPVNGSQPTEH